MAARHGGLLVFVGVGVVYLATLSQNLSIAHDSVAYASRILASTPVLHPNHLAYEPVLAWIIELLGAVGVHRSLTALTVVGAFAGAAAAAAAYKILVQRFGVAVSVAIWTVVACAASFGPWYYSVGVEIYIYPLAFLAWSFYFLTGAQGRSSVAAVSTAAALHAFAILFHQTSILFALVPVLVLLGERNRMFAARVRLLGLYVFIGSIIVVSAYGAAVLHVARVNDAASLATWFLGYGSGGEYWTPLGVKALVLAGVGFGRSLIGGHFVFAVDALVGPLSSVFSGKSLADEAYLLQRAPGFLPPLLLAGACLWGLGAVATAVAAVRARSHDRRGFGDLLPLLVWFLPYAAFFTLWDGGNVDFWVNQAFVFWIGAGVLMDRALAERRAAIRMAALGLGLLAINGAGTIVPATDASNDFYSQKVLALTAPIEAGALVVMADDWPDGNHIRFRTDAETVAIARLRDGDPPVDRVRRALASGRPVYLWSDVRDVSSASEQFYGPELAERLETLNRQICGANPVSRFAEYEVFVVTCVR